MAFQKGRSGNPGGRPRKGDSMAEAIRQRFNPAKRNQAIDALVLDVQRGDAEQRRRTFETLAKHGWPHEQKATEMYFPNAKAVTVIHEHVE